MKCKALLIVAAFLFLSCNPGVKTQNSLLEYLLPNPAMLVKITNLSNLKSELKNNTFLGRIKQFPGYAALSRTLQGLQYVAEDAPALLALYEVGKGQYEFILIAQNQPDLIDLHKIPNTATETFPYQDKTLTKYTFANGQLYTMQHQEELVLSSSLMLIENTVRVKKNNPVDTTLRKLYQTSAPSKAATLFVKAAEPSSLFALPQTAKTTAPRPFLEWVALDFSANSGKVVLNGVAISAEATKNFINLFKGTTPLANKTPLYAPLNAQAVLSYTFDDYSVFAQNQNMHLDRVKPIDSLFTTVEEVGLVYFNTEKVVLLHSYGAESLSDYVYTHKSATTSYRGKEIIQLRNKGFVVEGFTPLVQDFESNFCVILDNTFAFAESKAALQTLINSYGNASSFSEAPVYATAKKNLANESSILCIANADGMEVFAAQPFAPTLLKAIAQAKVPEYAFAAQLVADQDFAHLNVLVSKTEKAVKSNAVTPLFTLELEADLATRPQFVKNHRTNQHEIVVQDQNNVLYLIATEGKVLWKKQLSSRIQGTIRQVDLYKNGRLQLAFCTYEQFLIIDRNGKEVPPFTKTFAGGALNPLAVFDYEGNRNYRFVVTQGKKVFMYNNRGNIVEGFTYTQAQSPIITAPKHFRVDTKDYLVFQLADKTLKILHRSGAERIPVRGKIDFSANEVVRYKNKFSVTNTKGVLHQINTQGKLIATPFSLYKDHGMDATNNTLVFMNDNTLSIKGRKVKLPLGVYTQPKIFYRYNKIYVSVTDLQNQKIYLFDSQAEPLPNFPVFGSSLIDLTDMDNDKHVELVAQDQENSLIVYRMN